MLYLTIVMRAISLVFLILSWLQPWWVLTLDGPGVDSPQAGEALRGIVTITGSTEAEGFSSYEVAFAYEGDASNWFVLNQSQEVVKSGPLAQWDTSTIADGLYRVRLTIVFKDGGRKDYLVSGLRVRNYSVIETSTPAPTQVSKPEKPLVTPQEMVTAIPTVVSTVVQKTATALPVNPASLSYSQYGQSFMLGFEITVALVGLGLIYWIIRKTIKK
jgi:hypothetical protein